MLILLNTLANFPFNLSHHEIKKLINNDNMEKIFETIQVLDVNVHQAFTGGKTRSINYFLPK